MNKFASVALAGAVAVSGIALTTGSAGAGNWGWHPPYQGPHYYAPRPYDPGPAIVAGTVFGLALGALATQPYYYDPYPPPPPPVAYYPTYSSSHFNWCAATYDTYDSITDTWTDFRGIVRRCIGPY